jgi:DNA polymerase-1
MICLVQNKEDLKKAYNFLSKEASLGADTETTGLDPLIDKILLIQLGTEKTQYVFDVARLKLNDLKLIFKIFESSNITKIFQNGKFDYKMLKSNFGVITQNLADTMIAEQLLTKGIKKRGFGLQELSEKYKTGKLNKKIREGFLNKKFGDSFTKEEIIYAAKDVEVLPLIYHEQLKIAEEKNMRKLLDLENHTVKVIAEIELNGIYLDQNLWLNLEEEALKNKEKSEKKLQKFFEPYSDLNLFGKLDINYDSWQQIKPLLEKVLKHDIDNTNEKYLEQFDHEVIDALFEYREATKKITTYGNIFLKHIHPVSKRIHAKYLQLGTDSGRMSCTDPNMQNIPHEQKYRTPFCAESKDYQIISADYANQELRVLTQLSKEPAWLKAIKEGKDLHTMVASMMFGLPEEKCGKGTEYRTKAKTIGFGTIYGLSAYGLAKQLKIEKSEAQKLLNTFFTDFPKIKEFLKERETITKKLKCAISPLDGRIRDLGNIDWDDWRKKGHALNIGKNHPIQGASASITKLALIKIQHYIEQNKKDAKIIAVIHDEILIECHKDIADEMSKIVSEKMIKAFNYFCPDVIMEVTPDIGNHWIH